MKKVLNYRERRVHKVLIDIMINFMVSGSMNELRFTHAANEAFRAEHGGLKRPELIFSAAIKGRGLLPKHFEKFKQIAEAHRKHLRNPLLFDYERVDNGRFNRRSFFCSVGLTRDLTPGNQRFAMPLLQSMEISIEDECHLMRSEERGMPVRIELQHVNFRHVQRTSKPLIYGQTATQHSFVLALALSKIIGLKMADEGITETPIILPHEDGIFLGYAIATPTCREDHKLKGTQTIREKSGIPRAFNMLAPGIVVTSETVKSFSDDYDCVIVLKTFYSHDEMNDDYLQLWKKLYPLIMPGNSEALEELWQAFLGAETEEEYCGYLKIAEPMSVRLAEIVKSQLWQDRVTRLQVGHLPSKRHGGEFGLNFVGR